ncbi:serine/arginine repetitive matrix protein 2-like [Phlebotomus argentipes]|uniref:serine/arginine repetitive matrix protein 2-like n=1 Tax=Phlebotomus argentipes TaxID=94469 RepID=UPI002892EAFB|nr:serine/arginine repetitive matrix protein 2-like [Phlebotomus argentipes]
MRRRMSYDDDEDIDALRLAALQSLNHTRKPISNPIQVVESVVPHHKLRFEEEIFNRTHPGGHPEATFCPAEKISVFSASGTTNGQWHSPAEQYVPPYVAPGAPTDVQLSPRSAAFVQQNTSILRRRKGDKSPSVTPPLYTAQAGPWDPVSPVFSFRSRTPSPPSPKRFYSRSPIRRERSISRSPPPAADIYRLRRRTRSRSPLARRQSPRFAGRSRNSSPRPVRSRRQSPRGSPPLRAARKPSRSPVRVLRHRSQSPPASKRTKSPLVRKPRRPREAPAARRRSPDRHVGGKYKNDRRPRNPPREVKEEKKAASPRPRRRSRSRTPQGDAKVAEKKAEEQKLEVESSGDKVPEEKERNPPSSGEEKEEVEDASEGENGADEIDLFASEESESENEGRFKSSSSKNERPTQATVSFSKLVTEPVASLTELKELPALSSVASAPRERSDRRPERSGREYNRSHRKRGRDRRNPRRERDSKSGGGKDADKDSRSKSSTRNHGESNMKMFKSTFQAVVVNDAKKPSDSSSGDAFSEKVVKDVDKRKVIQIKRPIFRETKDKSEADVQPNGQTTLGIGEGKVKKSIHLRLGGYATPNGEPSSSLSSVLATTSSKSIKSSSSSSSSLASVKKSWKTSEKV